MTEDHPGTAIGPQGNMVPGLAAAEAQLSLRTSPDLADIARLALDATVPGLRRRGDRLRRGTTNQGRGARTGILALRTVLSHQDGQLETACDTLIASLAQHYEDDVTVVLARVPGEPAARSGRDSG